MRSNPKTPWEELLQNHCKKGKKQEETGRRMKLKTTGNEVDPEWGAMKQIAQFPFCHDPTIFLSISSSPCRLSFEDGLRAWLTWLSGPLAAWPSSSLWLMRIVALWATWACLTIRTILIFVTRTLCNCNRSTIYRSTTDYKNRCFVIT